MCDVDIAQYDHRTIKCEEKNNGPTEYDKSSIIYHVLLLNVTMELSNMRKNLEDHECNKSMVSCDIDTA